MDRRMVSTTLEEVVTLKAGLSQAITCGNHFLEQTPESWEEDPLPEAFISTDKAFRKVMQLL